MLHIDTIQHDLHGVKEIFRFLLSWKKSKASTTVYLLDQMVDFNVGAWATMKAAKSAASSSVCTFKYYAYSYSV